MAKEESKEAENGQEEETKSAGSKSDKNDDFTNRKPGCETKKPVTFL